MKRKIDLNSDMGEGFGVWEMGDDFALLDYVDSTNMPVLGMLVIPSE